MFKPSVPSTIFLFALAALFAGLGNWQLERKAEKEALFEQFDNAPALGIGRALERNERFARIEAWGRFDTQRHLLLDNRMFRGRAGVHVLTPFILGDGQVILVNRGWLPLPPDRSYLPEVPTDGAARTIRGRLNGVRSEGPRLGPPDRLDPDRWPQLVTYLDPEPLSELYDTPLPPWLIQLDADEDEGFEDRQWKAAVMPASTHGAYAVQWFALAAAAIVIWLTLGYRAGGRRKGSDTE
jgi:surfeit locus 1 family protein